MFNKIIAVISCVLSIGAIRGEIKAASTISDLTVTVTENLDDGKRKTTDYPVKGQIFTSSEILVAPLKSDSLNFEALFKSSGALYARMQDPIDAFILFNEISKGGDVKVAIDYLMALSDPSVDSRLKGAYLKPDNIPFMIKRYASLKSIRPVLLVSEKEDIVVLYVWQIFGDEKLLTTAKLKRTALGWKLFPYVLSKELTPQMYHITQAIESNETKSGNLSIDIKPNGLK